MLQQLDRVELKQSPIFLDSGCRRYQTVTMRNQAIEEAIMTMQQRYMDQLTLAEIAEAAKLSPSHFDRIFHSMVGISPHVFLASIRLKEAKRLLLTTMNSITDICFDVGYTSLGTFTSRFTLMVGLPPGRFRELAKHHMMHTCPAEISEVCERFQNHQAHSKAGGIRGTLHTSQPFKGLIFTGLFTTPLPQRQPAGCVIQTTPGRYCLPPVPDGKYYLFSAAVHHSQRFLSILEHGPALLGGRHTPSIVVRNGSATEEREIVLTPSNWADPPIALAFPWFFIRQFC